MPPRERYGHERRAGQDPRREHVRRQRLDDGDIEASLTDPTGLFSFDTRFLSKWVLTMNGERLNALSTDDLQYFETRFFLVPGTGTVYVDAKLSVIRRRAVAHGFHEELTILNHDDKPVDLTVRVEAGSDFADLFEVKDALEKKGEYSDADRGWAPRARLRAGNLPARDDHLGERAGGDRRERPDLHRSHRAARELDDGSGCRHRRRRRDQHRRSVTASADSGHDPTCSGTSSGGSPMRRVSNATGSR